MSAHGVVEQLQPRRYFFNVLYSNEPDVDEVGEELPDDSAAWQETGLGQYQSVRDLDGKLKPGTDWRLDVLNQQRRVIYSIEVKAHRS